LPLLKNEVSPKKESFLAPARRAGFDFECQFILAKDGRKKSNPIIAAIILGFWYSFHAFFSGNTRRSSCLLQYKYPLAVSLDNREVR